MAQHSPTFTIMPHDQRCVLSWCTYHHSAINPGRHHVNGENAGASAHLAAWWLNQRSQQPVQIRSLRSQFSGIGLPGIPLSFHVLWGFLEFMATSHEKPRTLDHGEPHRAQPKDGRGAATLHVAGVPHGTQAGPELKRRKMSEMELGVWTWRKLVWNPYDLFNRVGKNTSHPFFEDLKVGALVTGPLKWYFRTLATNETGEIPWWTRKPTKIAMSQAKSAAICWSQEAPRHNQAGSKPRLQHRKRIGKLRTAIIPSRNETKATLLDLFRVGYLEIDEWMTWVPSHIQRSSGRHLKHSGGWHPVEPPPPVPCEYQNPNEFGDDLPKFTSCFKWIDPLKQANPRLSHGMPWLPLSPVLQHHVHPFSLWTCATGCHWLREATLEATLAPPLHRRCPPPPCTPRRWSSP